MTQPSERSLVERVRAIREAGLVERCHTIPHHGSYALGQHSWGVAVLLNIFWPERPDLTVFSLFHDMPERWTGDSPAQFIRATPLLATALKTKDREIASGLNIPCEHDLEPEDFAKFKACDRLEFWLWCEEQASMGNKQVFNAWQAIEDYIVNDPTTPDEVLQFMVKLKTERWYRTEETFK